MYCNDYMNFNDGTCCSSVEARTTLQIVTFIILACDNCSIYYHRKGCIEVSRDDQDMNIINFQKMNIRCHYYLLATTIPSSSPYQKWQ
ncbi:hypothetical protein NQ318_013465 [Aromia moschata]|uniref:Uncharacterized protein n=1 Tax=Aromia moschata TaxID=1265417 RepID=A0AAV8YD72_9CUCU|nr:hypothetical protein NQ318_013465 [Aromia moschata]